MKAVYLIISFLLSILFNPLLSQNVKVFGKIYNIKESSLSGCTVNINGTINDSQYAGLGSYEFQNIPVGSSEDLGIVRNDDFLNGINTLDLYLIQLHILGKKLLDSPYKIYAADVNKDKKISVADMVELRRLILHLSNNFSVANSWDFYVSNAFQDPNNPWLPPVEQTKHLDNIQTDQQVDFVGIKIGDVTWNAGVKGGFEVRNSFTFNLSAYNKEFKTGDEVFMYLKSDELERFKALQFTLDFDQKKLEFIDINEMQESITPDNFGLKYLDKGKITGSIILNEGQENENLFALKFKALEDGQLNESVKINSSLTPALAFNENGETFGLELLFRSDKKIIPGSSAILYQNIPNPFENDTRIKFLLSSQSDVKIGIYDLDGKLVKESKTNYPAGEHELMIYNGDLPGTGIYYYQLQTNQFTDTKKMIYIR